MGAKTGKALLITVAFIVFVLLYIAPKMKSDMTSEKGSNAESKQVLNLNLNLSVYLNTALKMLEPSQKLKVEQWNTQARFDSLAVMWDKFKRPDLAAFAIEEQAKRVKSAEFWFKAGNRYYYSVPFVQDQSEVPVLYQSAMRCFNAGLVMEPTNTDAKIMLASCYVEGTQDPMEGVSRLKALEQKDSNNVKLQLAFAFFSVKSGQLDKAIRRFKKVLDLNPDYLEAYLHLADAYEKQGDTNNTIAMLEVYSAKTPDPVTKLEIDKYILQLKQNNN